MAHLSGIDHALHSLLEVRQRLGHTTILSPHAAARRLAAYRHSTLPSLTGNGLSLPCTFSVMVPIMAEREAALERA